MPEIIKVGEPLITKTGTVVSRYIENGRFYKSVDFSKSINKIAKQKGLLKTVTLYGDGNCPVQIFDTFEHKIKNTETNQSKIAEPQDDKSVLDSYRNTNRNSILYKNYDAFTDKLKRDLRKYKDLIPTYLYDDIINRYGTEEKSIMKILQDNNIELDKIPLKDKKNKVCYFRKFIKSIEKTEKKFSEIRLADSDTRVSVVYTNAWSSSRLRSDLGQETCKTYGNPWSIFKEVWQKTLYPDNSIHATQNLADAFLIQMYNNGKRNYNGTNPLQKLEQEPELTKSKIGLLKRIYRGARDLWKEKSTLTNPFFLEFKATVDIEAMSKTIEDIEAHYKNAFLKYFWTDRRKLRFSEALQREYKNFDEKVELSNDIYEAIINEAMRETISAE